MAGSSPPSPTAPMMADADMLVSIANSGINSSPKTSPSRKKVTSASPPPPKVDAVAKEVQVATLMNKFSPKKIVAMAVDKITCFWILFFTYLVAGVCFFWSTLLTKTGLTNLAVTTITGFPSHKTGTKGCVILTQLGPVAAKLVYYYCVIVTLYSRSKIVLPSLAWSEPVATLYIKPAFDLSCLFTDRLLVVVDHQIYQFMNILDHPIDTVNAVFAWCVTSIFGPGEWSTAGGLNFIFNKAWLSWFNPLSYLTYFYKTLNSSYTFVYNLVFNQAWLAWINPAAYLAYCSTILAGMPSSKAGTRGRVIMTRLNFVSSAASNVYLFITDLYAYAKTWIPNFLLPTLFKLETLALTYITPFASFAEDVCDKFLTAADIKLNIIIAIPFNIADSLLYSLKNPMTTLVAIIAMCWSPVRVAAQWITVKIVPASYLATCIKLFKAVTQLPIPTLLTNIWNAMPESAVGRWGLVRILGIITAIHDFIVPMTLYKTILDLFGSTLTRIFASYPFTLLVKIVHPWVAFFLDPLYNMAVSSESLAQSIKYWTPAAAAAVAVIA